MRLEMQQSETRTLACGTKGSLVALLMVLSISPDASAVGLDIEGWLRRPGVKLVAVEFYATWCKPCMEAVPKWKALHQKYREDGLRLIVVSTRDAQGACMTPGWTPDEVICDDDGILADRFGANPLPAAYLWGWQGHLLASKAHVEEIETQIERWMRAAPRVDVQSAPVPAELGINKDELLDSVRGDLQRFDKMLVVATEEERRTLRALVRRSMESSTDELTSCEIGKEIGANSLLRALITRGPQPRLQLKLLSAERGGLIAAGSTRWLPNKAMVSMSEAVATLLNKLRLPSTQYPWGVRTIRPQVKVKRRASPSRKKIGVRPKRSTDAVLIKKRVVEDTFVLWGAVATAFAYLLPVVSAIAIEASKSQSDWDNIGPTLVPGAGPWISGSFGDDTVWGSVAGIYVKLFSALFLAGGLGTMVYGFYGEEKSTWIDPKSSDQKITMVPLIGPLVGAAVSVTW